MEIKRLIEIEEVERDVPVDKDNDGVTDQVDGEMFMKLLKKTSYNNYSNKTKLRKDLEDYF